jgi:hypothetical protein
MSGPAIGSIHERVGVREKKGGGYTHTATHVVGTIIRSSFVTTDKTNTRLTVIPMVTPRRFAPTMGSAMSNMIRPSVRHRCHRLGGSDTTDMG